MKQKPGPKTKSYEERKHSITTYHKGIVIKAHGGEEKLKRWLEKVAEEKQLVSNKIIELKKTQDGSK